MHITHGAYTFFFRDGMKKLCLVYFESIPDGRRLSPRLIPSFRGRAITSYNNMFNLYVPCVWWKRFPRLPVHCGTDRYCSLKDKLESVRLKNETGLERGEGVRDKGGGGSGRGVKGLSGQSTSREYFCVASMTWVHEYCACWHSELRPKQKHFVQPGYIKVHKTK